MKSGLLFAGWVVILFGLRARGSGWRTAAIGAATVWGVLVVTITELLSLLGGLTHVSLAIAWLVVDVAALVYFRRVLFPRMRQGQLASFGALHHQMASYKGSLTLLWGVGALLVLVAVVALLSPPNTWDVMAYHMPRIVHRIQNQSVAPYPTHELRQLYLSPGAEYAILQLHVLFGSDRLNNFAQWFSFLGSVIGVTLLARCMGAGYGGQVLAAVVCATIPQGILEASGAKNDYVVAFWLVVLAYYLFALWREPTWSHSLLSGGALGLAWLTKGTAYIFSGPLLLMWGLGALWRPKPAVLKGLVVAAILAIGINAAYFARNYRLLGSPFGPMPYGEATLKLTNDALSAGILVSNVLRNIALHLGTPIQSVNQRGLDAGGDSRAGGRSQ